GLGDLPSVILEDAAIALFDVGPLPRFVHKERVRRHRGEVLQRQVRLRRRPRILVAGSILLELRQLFARKSHRWRLATVSPRSIRFHQFAEVGGLLSYLADKSSSAIVASLHTGD